MKLKPIAFRFSHLGQTLITCSKCNRTVSHNTGHDEGWCFDQDTYKPSGTEYAGSMSFHVDEQIDHYCPKCMNK